MLFKNKYKTKSLRLQTWNYSSSGIYFITICTKDRKCILGEINNGKIYLSRIGKIINDFWLEISNHKMQTSKQFNKFNAGTKKLWQRDYYERIIRNEKDLYRTREYIINNPIFWSQDNATLTHT